jgi:hypothetical protein
LRHCAKASTSWRLQGIPESVLFNVTEQLTVTGAVVLIWFFFWWKIVKSEPQEDPHISPAELKYIQDSLGNVPHKVFLHLSNHS